MYTIETLSKINQRFLSSHYKLLQMDVDKVNMCVERIEKSRTTEKPTPGDIVRYTDEYGDYSDAFIERVENGKAHIAEHANVYIDLNEESENGLSEFVSSGGPFHCISLERMVYTEEQGKRRFWHFGHCGACADGGIDFFATVNIWECDMNKQKFSTKTHEKYYVSYDPEPEKRNSCYHFLTNSKAWKTEEDLQAWVRTFRGVVEPGNWKNQLIVWTYKNVEHHVSPEEYENLNVPEDTFRMNARIRRCKRIYDDQNCIVNTYFVWYWDEPGKDFYERAVEQNKVIDSYTLDCRDHKENEYARQEFKSGKTQPVELRIEVKNEKF